MRNLSMLLIAVSMIGSISAQAACWVANQDSGRLGFEGVTEGRPFDGQFNQFSVRLCLEDQDLSTAEIEVHVETASADTDSRDRDQTLKGESFFWVSQFPQANWVSDGMDVIDGEFTHQASGRLSLRDVTLDQPVHMSLIEDEQGPRLVGRASMMRLDYNVGTGEFEDTDFISNKVDVVFDLGLNAEP